MKRSAARRYHMDHLRWTVARFSRVFRAKVVEPGDWALGHNGALFTATMSALLSLPSSEVDAKGREPPRLRFDEFDLVTFPEAFVPVDAFVQTIGRLVGGGLSGCCHVGLRPRDDSASHLFSVPELRSLVGRLGSLSTTIARDLSGFRRWLDRQTKGNYNVASLFAVDARDELRLCLHPKAVKSKEEVSPLPERIMTEADLLVLVTLLPSDRSYLTITIQPLICADFLSLPMDRPGSPPMEALTAHADCFGGTLPDHVDVVSVVTCTPQVPGPDRDGKASRQWHDGFRKAFLTAAEGDKGSRHHFAAVVLSNPLRLPKGGHGGLSGVFLPQKPRNDAYHGDVLVSTYGRSGEGDGHNGWSRPAKKGLDAAGSRGFVAGLDPGTAPAAADVRILSFDLHRLPRDRSPWSPDMNLANCRVSWGSFDATGLLRFRPEEGADGR